MRTDIKPTNIQELLQKELTRKQFLQLLVVMAVSLLGFSNLLNMLSGNNRPATPDKKSSHGFGSSKFGA
jgi:hypothetical protein